MRRQTLSPASLLARFFKVLAVSSSSNQKGSSCSRSMTSAGTLYLIATQVFSRGLTFAGNQALLRYVSPAHLGLAVQLETLSTSVLYTARESLRVSLQRSPRSPNVSAGDKADVVHTQKAVNAAWLVVLLGTILGGIFGTSYLHYSAEELLSSRDFDLSLWLYTAATTLELLCEPSFVIIQQNALFRDRARAETSAATARCLTAVLTAVYMHKQRIPMSVLPFAAGQLAYGFGLFCVYTWTGARQARLSKFSILPTKLKPSSDVALVYLPKALLSMAVAFYLQSIFKWLLTQGDVVVLSTFADLASQGIFALASNYAGLLSRLLFQPIEESSRNAFGQMLATPSRDENKPVRAPTNSPATTQGRRQALRYLATVLRTYNIFITIPCVTLLPRVFPLVVQILLGSRSRWNAAETSRLLSTYSYYLPCLALNGVLDAFVTSVATAAELRAQALMMVGVTAIYLSTAYYGITTLGLGGVGLVYANILNMLLRIIFSLWFIASWIQDNLPHVPNTAVSDTRRFFVSSVPTLPSTMITLFVACVISAQQHIATYLPVPTIFAYSSLNTALSRLGMDLPELMYIITAAVLLVSVILTAEYKFLLEVLPVRVKQRLRLLDTAKSDKKQ